MSYIKNMLDHVAFDEVYFSVKSFTTLASYRNLCKLRVDIHVLEWTWQS